MQSRLKMLKTFAVFLFLSLSFGTRHSVGQLGFSSASTIKELETQTVDWLNKNNLSSRRITVRDFRQVGQQRNALRLTSTIKMFVADAGFELAQESDYELEGRVTSVESGDRRLILSLIDDQEMFSGFGDLTITLSKNLYAELEPDPNRSLGLNRSPEPKSTRSTLKPNFAVRPIAPLRWQISEENDWRIYNMAADALKHVRLSNNKTGFIIDQTNWAAFWQHLENDQPLPKVDFNTHAIVVLYEDRPTEIKYKVLTRGKVSSWDFVRDDKPGAGNANGRLDAVVLLLAREPKPCLGISIEMAPNGQSIKITEVMQDSAIAHGIDPDGKEISCEPGDLITAIDGRPAVSERQLVNAVNQSGESIVLDIQDVRTGIVRPMVFYPR